MKMLLCSDVQLGAVCEENLGVKLSHKWGAERTAKFADLIDRAAQNNAGYVLLVGKLFGSDRIPESSIDALFKAVKEDEHIQVLAFLDKAEYKRVLYRNDIPENLHILCTNSSLSSSNNEVTDNYLDECLAARSGDSLIEMQLSDNDPVKIFKGSNGVFELTLKDEKVSVPIFEPVGFKDAAEKRTGYIVLEWSDETVDDCTVITNRKYNFETGDIRISPADTQREILNKINKEAAERKFDTFLRLTIHGRSPFGVTLNSDAIEEKLRDRLFFVEIYDNTVMDIDESAFETDISLRSEFVRLALQDESLSETERNKLISCGWNALGGKGVSAE